ncbi:MAG: thiamine pyrophosphate-dependent enzyme, partial [Corynebacterium sp.]|nr:thiamine pyrophosphate-dependent enzyme [Corynebacterium sp.]
SSLGMVKLEMLVEGMPEHETDHAPVDFSAVAESAGIKAIRVEKPKNVRRAVREALDHDGPVLVEFITDPNALSIPPTLTMEQLLGFSKAATREVFDGGVGKMMDLATSNLRNIPR